MSKARGLADLGNVYDDGALSNRSKIINGAMVIDQRNAGAVFTSTGLFYSLDRWLLQAVGATNTAQQVTGSTGNNKAVLITGNSGNTFTAYSQKIESWNIQDVAGQPVTVSFTLSGSASGSVSVRQLYPTATDNYTATTEPVSGTTVNFTTTPTRYTVTFTADANANKGLWLVFDFGAVGAGVTRTLEEVQLEAGDTATPFEHRSYGQELALCQRYYYNTYDTPQSSGSADSGVTSPTLNNGDRYAVNYPFPTTMRANPTVTYYGGRSAVADTADRVCQYNGNNLRTFVTEPFPSHKGLTGYFDTGGIVDNAIRFHFTADAEL